MSITKNIIASMLAIAILVVGAVAVSAHESGQQDPERQAQHEAVKKAIESGDYETFSELTEESGRFSEVTADNFSKLAEAHSLAQSGDMVGAKAIFDELGFEPPHRGKRGGNMEGREDVREAVENGDYATWSQLLEEKGRDSEFISEKNFSIIQQAHELREAGDHDGARELMEEAGIQPPGRGNGECDHPGQFRGQGGPEQVQS